MDKILSKVSPLKNDIFNGIRHIHLVGIGGVGMSGLALLLKGKGFSVSGSDSSDSYQIKMLKDQDIQVFIGHSRNQLSKDIQMLGYSSAVRQDNPEIQEANKRSLPILKRGQLLAELCRGNKTIAVAGSHGKTTTTAMLGHLLTCLGYAPTVFLGGLSLNYSRGAWWGSEHCVIETDESDRSFLYYNPWVSIITNIDYEHIDHYKTMTELEQSFLEFANNTKAQVFGWGGQKEVLDIVDKVKGISFGWEESNQVQGRNFRFDRKYSCFDLYIKGKLITPVKLPLVGEYNCRNSLAALACLWYLNEDLVKAAEILEDFRGTKRRFELKAKVFGVTFIDDYAHHPTEIKAVIKAASLMRPKRLFVVFQPHRYSRVKLLQEQFLTCFSDADRVVVTDIYSASEINSREINAKELAEQIGRQSATDVTYLRRDKLSEVIPQELKAGDLVLALGAGDIDKLMNQVIYEFKKSRTS